MKIMNNIMRLVIATCFFVPNSTGTTSWIKKEATESVTNNQTLYYQLHNEVLENHKQITMDFQDQDLQGYDVTWSVIDASFQEDTTPVYFKNDEAKRLSKTTTSFNKVDVFFNAPGTSTIEVKACQTNSPSQCLTSQKLYVEVANPELSFTQDISQLRYLEEQDDLHLVLNEQQAIDWQSYYDITWSVDDRDLVRLFDKDNQRFTNQLTYQEGQATIQSFKKGKTIIHADIIHKKNPNIKASAVLDVVVKDLLSDTELFVNNDDVRVEVGDFIPYYTAPQATLSLSNTTSSNGVAVGFKNQINFDAYRELITTKIQDEAILKLIPYVKYNGMNIPLEEASEEAKKGQTFYAFKAMNTGSTTITYRYGEKVVSTKVRVSEKLNNRVILDPSGDAKEDHIDFNIAKESLRTTSGDTRAKVRLNLTKSAIDTMIMSSKSNPLHINIRFPETIRDQADIEQILISRNTLEAARNYQKDLLFRITNEYDKLLYSWNFKSKDLTQIGYDLDISLDKRKVKDAYTIDALAQDTRAMVVNFHHEGALPALAMMKLYVGDMGYQANETVYLYYYDESNQTLVNEWKNENHFVIDEALYVEFPLQHCSDYVLTTKPLSDETSMKAIQDTTSTSSKGGGALTGMGSQAILFLGVMMLCELVFVYTKKKSQQLNEKQN